MESLQSEVLSYWTSLTHFATNLQHIQLPRKKKKVKISTRGKVLTATTFSFSLLLQIFLKMPLCYKKLWKSYLTELHFLFCHSCSERAAQRKTVLSKKTLFMKNLLWTFSVCIHCIKKFLDTDFIHQFFWGQHSYICNN